MASRGPVSARDPVLKKDNFFGACHKAARIEPVTRGSVYVRPRRGIGIAQF